MGTSHARQLIKIYISLVADSDEAMNKNFYSSHLQLGRHLRAYLAFGCPHSRGRNQYVKYLRRARYLCERTDTLKLRLALFKLSKVLLRKSIIFVASSDQGSLVVGMITAGIKMEASLTHREF